MRRLHFDLREIHSIGLKTQEWLVPSEHVPALEEHGLWMVGWSEAREGFAYTRPDWELGHVLIGLEGTGAVYVDGSWQLCEPGQGYLTPPHALHAYRALPDVSVWRVAWAACRAPYISASVPQLVSVKPEPFFSLVRQLHAEATDEANPEALEHGAALLALHLRRICHTETGDPRLRAAFDVVRRDLAHPWTLSELATRAGLSDEHLRRLCTAEHGHSPMARVTQLRMQHAASLLHSGRYTVAEVAHRVGYENPFAFSTAFRRTQGISPSTLRHSSEVALQRV
jgi:AraC-like DNA-binding protein